MMRSNYALERSVTGLSERAAGARTIIAPAARLPRLARPLNAGSKDFPVLSTVRIFWFVTVRRWLEQEGRTAGL